VWSEEHRVCSANAWCVCVCVCVCGLDQGMVEKWLFEVEESMVLSIRDVILQSLEPCPPVFYYLCVCVV